MDLQLSGQAAIVTGASRGLGAAIVRQLAAEGVSVVLNYGQSREAAEAVRASVGTEAGRVALFQGDVRDPATARALIAYAVSEFGRLDILVNNAGVIVRKSFLEMPLEDFDLMIDTNLRGTWNCGQAAARHMAQHRYGRILNCSSIGATLPAAGHCAYSASKAAIEALTRVMAGELAPYNILVNAYVPGTYDTDGVKQVVATRNEELLASIGLRRLGRPEEIARLVTFLVSPVNSYMSGSTVLAHGAKLTLQNPMKPWRDAGLLS